MGLGVLLSQTPALTALVLLPIPLKRDRAKICQGPATSCTKKATRSPVQSWEGSLELMGRGLGVDPSPLVPWDLRGVPVAEVTR